MLSTAHALNGRNSESKSEVGPKKKLARTTQCTDNSEDVRHSSRGLTYFQG